MESFQGKSTFHKPLTNPADIRVIRVHAANFQDPVRCELEHVSLDEKPEYWTLSYSWGDPDVTTPIYLGEQEYPVTTNLALFLRHFQAILQAVSAAVPLAARPSTHKFHELVYLALRHLPQGCIDGPPEQLVEVITARIVRPLFARTYASFFSHGGLSEDQCYDIWSKRSPDGSDAKATTSACIWIDALSINQTDVSERSREVTRMRHIYEESSFLVIWLGDPGGNSSSIREAFGFMDAVVHCYDGVDGHQPRPIVQDSRDKSRLEHAGDPVDVDRALANIPPQYRHAYNHLAALLERDWFRRVWCIQELAVVRHEPVVLCGFYSACWETLCQACGAMYLFTQNHPQAARFSGIARNAIKLRTTRTTFRASQPVPAGAAAALYRLVIEAGEHKATDPRDKLYALLGLLGGADASLPADLQPDYAQPVCEVYRAYAAYLIRRTGRLTVLGVRESSVSGGCSWVPNWQDMRLAALMDLVPPQIQASYVELSGDGRHLELEGVSLGSLQAVCPVGSFGAVLEAHQHFVHGIHSDSKVMYKDGAFSLAPILLELEFKLASLCRQSLLPVDFGQALVEMLDTLGPNVKRSQYEEIVGRKTPAADDMDQPFRDVLSLVEGLTFLQGSCICLIHNGQESHVLLGASPDVVGIPADHKGVLTTDTVCMFKGAISPRCLRRTEDGQAWRLVDVLRSSEFVDPDASFYDARHVERFLLE